MKEQEDIFKKYRIRLSAHQNMAVLSPMQTLNFCRAMRDFETQLLSDRDKFAIEFKDWCDKLSFMDKVTVHPIAGSGGGNGPRELTNSELLETYLRKLFHSQKQTQG